MDINVHIVTLIICTVCIFYTTIGGLKAVVWTDAIQSVFTSGSIIVVVILGLIEIGGFDSLIKSNREGDRIEFFKMDPNPFLRNTFWTIGIGMTIQWVTHLGIHPGTVQRFVSLPSYKKARYSLMYFLLGVGVVQGLTGLIGMLIYAKYKDCDPISANYINSDRNLVPYFVMDVAGKYPGLTGIFISGIISTSLSVMSAQLNTVSGTIYEDFVVKLIGIKCSDLTASTIMKCTVVIAGIICAALIIVVEKLKGIMQLSLSLYGITNGAIMSVFTLGICFPRANSKGAMYGMLASIGVMTWIVFGAQIAITKNELVFVEKNVTVVGCPTNITVRRAIDLTGLYRMNEDVYVSPKVWKIYTVSYMHYSTIGTFIGIIVGIVVSWLFPSDQKVDPRLLTPIIRQLMHPDYKNREMLNKNETGQIVSLDTLGRPG
uniref:Sodium-coupled monocarboxylate transporter 2 n=1 Tax=Sipha flava TaxID=143950 RepID=A0A2S2RBZ7_9HEMI